MAFKLFAFMLCSCQMAAFLLLQLYSTDQKTARGRTDPALSPQSFSNSQSWRARVSADPSNPESFNVHPRGRLHSNSSAEKYKSTNIFTKALSKKHVDKFKRAESRRQFNSIDEITNPTTYSHLNAELSFTYSIDQTDLCSSENGGPDPFILIQVHSHLSHKPLRDAIRETWGRISRDYDKQRQVRLVFLLGEGDNTADFTSKIKHENKLYRDIIIANFRDTYRNLTLKSLAGLSWATKNCANSRYFFKTDDDVYFNVTSLLNLLVRTNITSNILGALNNNATVNRRGLWAVDRDIYPEETFPPYCAGNSYVMTMETAADLLEAVPRATLLPIEDVYVTGVLAQLTGKTCQGHPSFPHWYVGPSPKHVCALMDNKLLGVHNVQYEKMHRLYRKIQAGEVCDKNLNQDHHLNKAGI